AVIRIPHKLAAVRRTAGELARGFREASRPHIAHHRKAGRSGKRAHHVIARDTGNGGDLVKRQRLAQMAFDEPERLLRGIHGSTLLTKQPHHARFARAAFDSICAFSCLWPLRRNAAAALMLPAHSRLAENAARPLLATQSQSTHTHARIGPTTKEASPSRTS